MNSGIRAVYQKIDDLFGRHVYYLCVWNSWQKRWDLEEPSETAHVGIPFGEWVYQARDEATGAWICKPDANRHPIGECPTFSATDLAELLDD
jgi:hypothetical protein